MPQSQNAEPATPKHKVCIDDLSLFYGKKHRILKGVSMQIQQNTITALIGPSGCGKTSLLKCINKMHDHVPGYKVKGSIKVDEEELYSRKCDLILLRMKVGMVFQRATPFPCSIFKNVAFGPKLHSTYKNKAELEDIVEDSLKRAGLWNEVKDRLKENPSNLSGGQQQRLCIARTIATHPNIILMDEPCSALDPIATSKIEELLYSLKQHYTIIIVTHSMQQAARVSCKTAFLLDGMLVEHSDTKTLFTNPLQQSTQDYITGRLG